MANTVLITGASRGIGAATARYFGEQGWQVAVHYHEREDLALELVRELREMGTCAVAWARIWPARIRPLPFLLGRKKLSPLWTLWCAAPGSPCPSSSSRIPATMNGGA